MSATHRMLAAAKHFFRANRKGHGVHSPFVYALARHVIPAQKEKSSATHPAERWRKNFSADHTIIHVTDFGTGKSGPRKLSDIARRSAKSPAAGQLLQRIVGHFQPSRLLELGTSLGITSLYEAGAAPRSTFISLEGCPATAAEAEKVFAAEQCNIRVITGPFESTLRPALDALGKADYIFFDGNHREKPTLDYFETCLPYAHKDSLFIFDDIHWSAEMERAWEKIKAHPQVRITIDVFDFGMVFFREENREKEHFVLR